MCDAVSLSDAPAFQRAVGELRVSVRTRDGRTALDGLRQSGCLKARFPRRDDDAWMNVVTLNTSGGIAGGDTLESVYAIGAGGRVTIASQAAERFYRALPGGSASNVWTRIELAENGSVEWLPQETILFNRCAVRRRLQVELAGDASFLGVESLVFGRTAMGEDVARGSLRDVIEVRRSGQLLLHDVTRLEGEVAATLRRPAIGNGARAVATLIYVARDAEAKLDPLRELRIGASVWDGLLVARLLAANGAALRAVVIDALSVLRDGRALPRVWLC